MSHSHVLFLSACTPSPTGTGWEQRAFRFVAAYASLMKVSIWIGVTALETSQEITKDLADLCEDIKIFTSSDVYSAPWDHKLVRRLLSLKPLLATMPFRKEFLHKLCQAICRYDLVHFCRDSRYLRPKVERYAKSTVCDLDEVPWNVRRSRQLHKMPLKRPNSILYRPAKRWDDFRNSRFFSRELDHFSTVFLCSTLEADELPANASVCVAPNTVEVPEGGANDYCQTSANDCCLFVGNLNYSPNQDALTFFAKEVWPEIRRCCPEGKFIIAGRSLQKQCDEGFKHILERPDFELQADVPDLSPLYCQASVCVAPIRYGGGTRVKIIEAFAHKRAVVSTKVGCEGLAVAHEEQLLVADDPKSFAKQCVRLLHDAPLRRHLSQAAYDYYLKNHTPDAFNSIVTTELRRLGMSI